MSTTAETPEQAPEPVKFELDNGDIYAKYMLYSRAEILFVMRSLLKKTCMTTVYFDSGRSFFLTALLDIDDRSGALFFDVGSDQTVNARALKAEKLLCTALLDKVKIQFSLNGLQNAQHGGRLAFRAQLPSAILRLQRREYFRLDTPQGNPIVCQTKIPREGGSELALNLTLLDISGGGVGLMAPIDMETTIVVGMILPNCRMELPEEGVLQISLTVRNQFRVTARNGNQYLRLGCEFIDLPGNRLTMIQRYITRIERERKARLSGWE